MEPTSTVKGAAMPGRFELKKSRGQFMFNLKASNGKTVLTSERYKTKASAVNGIKSVKKNAKKVSAFEERKAKNGSPYFVQKAGNGEVIGRSEMYASNQGMRNGIASVRKNAPGAKTDDNA